jgi:hypothetical protein
VTLKFFVTLGSVLIFHKLQNEATLVGLNINEAKTKYMQINRTGTKDMTHLKLIILPLNMLKILIIWAPF